MFIKTIKMHYFPEYGFKLLGIAGWLCYFGWTSYALLIDKNDDKKSV